MALNNVVQCVYIRDYRNGFICIPWLSGFKRLSLNIVYNHGGYIQEKKLVRHWSKVLNHVASLVIKQMIIREPFQVTFYEILNNVSNALWNILLQTAIIQNVGKTCVNNFVNIIFFIFCWVIGIQMLLACHTLKTKTNNFPRFIFLCHVFRRWQGRYR